MSEHTPGPWVASKDQDARGWHGWRIDSDSRALMAWAAWPSEEERDGIEAESTALLIAAAPDLLAALIDAVSCLEFAAPIIEAPEKSAYRESITAARAAIAKARGE